MRTELFDFLTAYLMGWKTLRDCAQWLAGIDWNDSNLSSQVTNVVGRLELLSTEVLEGLRAEVDFWQEAAGFVAAETNSLYSLYSKSEFSTDSNIANSSNDTISRSPEVMVAGVGGSQLWSISPLLVSE